MTEMVSGRWGGRASPHAGARDSEWSESDHPRGEAGKFSSGGGKSSGHQLKGAMTDRSKFDKLLNEYAGTHSKKQLKEAYKDMTGYEYYPNSATTGTKADIVAALKNRQREDELNRDLHAAQAKLPV